MDDKTIVVTGANSYLGSATVSHLLKNSNWQVCALVSPRATCPPAAGAGERVRHIRADLTHPLADEVRDELESADRVIHFAWIRGKNIDEVDRLNQAMIESVMNAMAQPSRFCLISSVAASPRALSTYGQAKYRAMQLVSERGGISLVCGLVVDEHPRGPFELLMRSVKKLPVSLRFKNGGPQVYPVHIYDVAVTVLRISELNLDIGHYKLFAGGTDLNSFLTMLENLFNRKRIPVRINASFLLRTAFFLKWARLSPAGLSDKLLTFLHKDTEYLMLHQDIPGMSYRPICQATFQIT